MKEKRIVITGSHGFIGEAIIAELQGNEIYRVKRSDYYDLDLKAELKKFYPHIIIHAGAYGNHFTQTDDMETFEANVIKTFLLLEATKDIPYEVFLNFGSSSEYGQKQFVMREDYLLEPVTMYGCTKAAGTMLARAFAKKYNKPVVTVRPFSVYGPGEADFRFIPTVCRSLIKGEEFTLDSQSYHDWIYIDDLVKGILTVIDTVKVLTGQAINIGTGKQYRNRDIVNLLSLISEKKPIIKESSLRPGDSLNWKADISLLNLCGWSPQVLLFAGLKKTYQYYERKYSQ